MPSTYRTILCPTDLSPICGPAVDLAYALAAPDSVVHLLHVSEPLVLASPLDGTVLAYANDPMERDAKERSATTQMRQIVPSGAAQSGVRTETSVVQEPGVTTQILAMAARVHADVIVMGTHGRAGFGRLLMGSVATEVLRKSPIPVVLVRDRRVS